MTKNVVEFAHSELEKFLELMDTKATISLHLFSEMSITDENVKDDKYDDAIEINIKDKCGYIAGSNERSILIGVYRLLNEWGIKWVRPGKNGTYIPPICNARDIFIHEAAAKRHRAICIEGAVSLENVIDMIDWLPKMGYNGYFIQFNDAFIFFDRWYSHRDNPYRSAEPFTVEKSLEFVDILIHEIKKRGLLLQRMGHGWTCEPFGVPNHGWDPVSDDEIPSSYVNICAEVKGQRKVWMNMPVATQLCYSNPYVRDTIVDGVIDYIIKHKETDIVHFWLGDAPNNTCECEECIKMNLSDYYVKMINDITRRMKELGLNCKIVIIIYYNSAHPPKTESVISSENTILMFAPISRTFGSAFPDEFKIKSIPKYAVNSFDLPRSVDENLAYLYSWEQCYSGDTVDFDYHLMWDHILDAGGECIANVLHTDIKNFDNLGMNGFISCQLQRNFFPNSIAMTVLAKTLWDSNTDFDKTRRDLYAAAYGEENADILCEYFATLSKGFDIGALRSQIEIDSETLKKNLETAVSAMDNIKSIISENINVEDPCHRESWKILSIHREIYSLLGQSIILRIDGENERADKTLEESIKTAWENEDSIQSVLDCLFYQSMVKERININGAIPFLEY